MYWSSVDWVTTDISTDTSVEMLIEAPAPAKLQNTRPLISISLNKNSNYCYIPCSSKHTDTCKWSGPVFWSCSEAPHKVLDPNWFFDILDKTQISWTVTNFALLHFISKVLLLFSSIKCFFFYQLSRMFNFGGIWRQKVEILLLPIVTAFLYACNEGKLYYALS